MEQGKTEQQITSVCMVTSNLVAWPTTTTSMYVLLAGVQKSRRKHRLHGHHHNGQ